MAVAHWYEGDVSALKVESQVEIPRCRGDDPDALVWDLGNSRPHKYYW